MACADAGVHDPLGRGLDKLGKRDEAKAALNRLRESIKRPVYAKSSLYQAMRCEAAAQFELAALVEK
jgi:hypothetical protein